MNWILLKLKLFLFYGKMSKYSFKPAIYTTHIHKGYWSYNKNHRLDEPFYKGLIFLVH